jgi:hypothetical protein
MQLGRILARWKPQVWRSIRRLNKRRRRSRGREHRLDSKRAGRLASALAAATCALLGGTGGPPALAADEQPTHWRFDSALLLYDEGDRVQDASLNFVAGKLFSNGQGLSLRLGVDALTGASASGAVAALGAQTFTTPSGNASYQTTAGEIPLDPTFLDTRIAVSGTWTRPLGRRSGIDLGLSLSNEYDYFHAGVNSQFRRDFNERNTTLTAGVAVAFDDIDPVGGAPIPLAMMLPTTQTGNKLAGDTKTVLDVLLGVTQVFGQRTIGQLNYSYSDSSGYLTDPYKVLSVVDPISGNPTAGPGSLSLYLFEARPDSRAKHSLFAQVKRQIGNSVLDASYRYMTDDWGIGSHTVDLRYRWRFKSFHLQPHVRYYTQTAADFYRGVLLEGDPLPGYASADYRLSDLKGMTYGIKLGFPTAKGREWSVRVEYYDQSSETPSETQVGVLSSLYVDPTVDALIVQTGFRF